MLSKTEENYLKAILKLTVEEDAKMAGTNDIAASLAVKPATVNSMLKKLKAKKLVDFEKYGKIALTQEGRQLALMIVRKHRLWETFLFEVLEFNWDEVHEIAEQLEHIKSEKLVNQIDKFLNYPTKDPHGESIPNQKGEMAASYKKTLLSIKAGTNCTMLGVKNDSTTFLQYVEKTGLQIGQSLTVMSKQKFDNLIEIEVNGFKTYVSEKFAENIYVR